MKQPRIIFICFTFLACSFLIGCHKRGSAEIAANNYVAQIKAVSKSKIPIKTTITPIAPVPYSAGKTRDPFELPVNDEKSKKYPNTILKDVALDSIKLVGIVMNAKQSWAIIRTNKGELYRITVGTRIGLQQSLLTQIEQNQVKFTQEVNTPSGTQNKVIVMPLQAPEEPKK